ncbi:MAG: bifunctional demethylmenaquinone methyltransferase/2-methoxy-6-polyprenyl-1,4-benzoquinol methylase UbiE [Alphaproteobacteria bacterium]|nr:bifunctional demethylmenaquinone methyltransferase/2-methoxy-6-polyprenyl-1,4-benzoquinol methylase UbiE [Alphaproteobacteria bacterium]
MNNSQTHFGYETIDASEKVTRVRGVFSSVASNYDIMNDLMSAGMHRLWKDTFVSKVHADANSTLLDVAGGTGDIAVRLYKKTGAAVNVCDINEQMLRAGQDRQFDKGETAKLRWVCGNAESLPLPDNSVDVYTIAFGLRNVTDIPKALKEAHRVLKIGGQFLCLEFSKVNEPLLAKIYEKYSFNIIPKIGELVAKDRASYQYLVESIRMFPKQRELVKLMESCGFGRVTFDNLSLGVVAIHQGWKI